MATIQKILVEVSIIHCIYHKAMSLEKLVVGRDDLLTKTFLQHVLGAVTLCRCESFPLHASDEVATSLTEVTFLFYSCPSDGRTGPL